MSQALKIAAIATSILSFISFCIATLGPGWILLDLPGSFSQFGLFYICNSNAGCAIPDAGDQSFARTMVTLMVLATLFSLCGIIFLTLGVTKPKKNFIMATIILEALAAIFSIAAVSFYTDDAIVSLTVSATPAAYGYSYAFAWIGSIASVVTGVISYLYSRKA